MPIFAPIDEENLMSQGLLSPPSEHGTRRIHKRRLHQFSDREYSDIPLTPSSLSSDDSSSIIPENMLSIATIKYVGFDDATAHSIWRTWLTWTPDGRVQETENSKDCDFSFFEHLISSVIRHKPHDVFSEDDQEWRNLLQRMGIDQRTQNAIMDPFFKVCRLNGTCVECVEETVEARYRTLEMIQAESRKRDMELQRQRHRQGPGPQSS
ncbi:hypothetical protein AAL_06214 [Moelleriella libera RCEF 2490]|uniref:Uncharacterized protein n=1 Tax=Moelleriella libera RCEF 2490 TaxID=1081109 RepID=A0A167ZFC9_9HYPO|nr:hypothetical protein AAL_06214 [Moelleriella libera RCEF 2490]